MQRWFDRLDGLDGLRLLLLLVPLACSVADGEHAAVPSDAAVRPRPRARRSLLLHQSGKLVDMVRGLRRMDAQSRSYTPPSEAQLALGRIAFGKLIEGSYRSASELFAVLGFDVIDLRDGARRYLVVRETLELPIRGWGFFAVDPSPARPYVIQAPHVVNDARTGLQAARLARRLGARGLVISTAYRCATPDRSRCSGKTTACGSKRRWLPYRVSDLGHTDQSLFHVAHVALHESGPDLLSIQLHGFDRRPDRRLHYVLSDGTRLLGGRSRLSNRLARLLRRALGSRRAVASCNEPTQRAVPLCGTQNVQGRHANGSRRPCRWRARRSRNRFLHVEQSLDARVPGGRVEPRDLADALALLHLPLRRLFRPSALPTRLPHR